MKVYTIGSSKKSAEQFPSVDFGAGEKIRAGARLSP